MPHIACAEYQAWDALLAGINKDPWRRPRKYVIMDKLCLWGPPAKESIDSAFLEKIVGILFLANAKSGANLGDRPVRQCH